MQEIFLPMNKINREGELFRFSNLSRGGTSAKNFNTSNLQYHCRGFTLLSLRN